jgi:hypothetical protein
MIGAIRSIRSGGVLHCTALHFTLCFESDTSLLATRRARRLTVEVQRDAARDLKLRQRLAQAEGILGAQLEI